MGYTAEEIEKSDEMSGESPRWQGPKSDFPWEEDALRHIRDQMPEAEPYRAWQTFTFTASSGHVREVDLFIATPGGLFLVEIKSHPGRAANNGSTWVFKDDDRLRTIENPLHFTDSKAKDLREQLIRAAREIGLKHLHIPRIEVAVFLSAPNLRCEFDQFQRQRVYGRDKLEDQTTLDGIWAGFLNQPAHSDKDRVTPTFSKQLPKLFQKIGVQRLRKNGKVGPYELAQRAFDAGPTWEDYLAENPSLPGDEPRRIRIYLSELKATTQERESTRRAARREYLALQGISHDGIVRAEQHSDEHQAGPAVVFRHGRDWQRLDHFLAAQGKDLPVDTRVEMIRQLAEAIDHAHRRHLYHRALAARCVYVEMDGRYPRLRICDWQVAARPVQGATATMTALSPGAASLATHIERSAGPYLAPEFGKPDAPAVQLDVFGLGALSYVILTGQAPAGTREQLGQRLEADRALVPSSVDDSITPVMDDLVRSATTVQPADRTESVRDFLADLDQVEDELTAPDREPAADPLAAAMGDEVEGWTVERVLGKGSTSRALLVKKGDQQRVFKVALNDSAARRLRREAEQLGQLIDSHVARLIDPPFEAGPDDQRRTLIAVEYVGDRTLADEIRQHGPLTIHELERLGEDLFQAVKFLDGRSVWHRDIKPDNLALRELDRKGRELVLFDFSLAGTPDSEIAVGTTDYLDPFLGYDRRTRYDQAAELYAVAVTLHEMASGELPSWGDDLIQARLLDPREQVQLAEDIFDPVLRDGLVEFFRQALHRDATKRFGSLRAMTRAWTDVFHDLDAVLPLTTPDTIDLDESADAKQARQAAVDAATEETPLAAAGLTARALSIAQQRLGVSTVGELVRIQSRRIMRLRGIGISPRNELVRRSREWRLRLRLAETAAHTGEKIHPERAVVLPPRTAPPPVATGAVADEAAPPDLADAAEDLAHLSVDDVVRRLIPEAPDLARVVGLPGPDGLPSPVPSWADQREIAERTGLKEDEVASLLDRLRSRWAKSVPALAPLRADVLRILEDHGRVLEWRQLAAALLARRGSELIDPGARIALAGVCVRAAIETEERTQDPRLATRRHGDRVLVALTRDDTAASGRDGIAAIGTDGTAAPDSDDLFTFAEWLGERADELAGRDPLPGVTEIKQALRDVLAGDPAPKLSDTDLVLLAAAASAKAAATPRLELYPRDLPPLRSLRISQAASFLGDPGVRPEEVVQRVVARFPELTNPPKPAEVFRMLRDMGRDVMWRDGKIAEPSATQLSRTNRTNRARRRGSGIGSGIEADKHAWQRLEESCQRGGFVAVKVRMKEAIAVTEAIADLDGVTPFDVTVEFVQALKDIVAEQGRPRWESVLAADSDAATPAAKVGFARLVETAWRRLEEQIRSVGSGIVFLHDATPLARYPGGTDLLARLAGAARRSGASPRGLWLLCPMQDEHTAPRLDDKTVGVIPGDAEQLVVPNGFSMASRPRRVS
jgi:serine/threonine protein kinase